MKKILVTGADGFIGSHLTELLLTKGHKVRALSYYNSFNSWGHLESIEKTPNLEIISGDIRDPHFCLDLCKDVDWVFHLAALIAIPYSYQSPQNYIDTNITGTLNMCQAARTHKIERFIQTSTSEVYGSAQYVPIDEDHPLRPQSPYSASKIGADAMAMSFYYSFELPVIVARPFNTYGPRQSARAVIPTIISQLSAGKKRLTLGDIHTTRDFNYVQDTCRGLLALINCPDAIGEVVNIGSNHDISIKDIVTKIESLMGVSCEIEVDPQRIRPKNSEVQRLKCNNEKLIKLTNFRPEFDLDCGLKKTIEWFQQKKNLKDYKIDVYNI